MLRLTRQNIGGNLSLIFWRYQIIILVSWHRKGGNMPQKKRGRPTSENPKIERVDVRLTETELQILDSYCKEKGISRPQGLRDGLYALKQK